MKIKYMWIPFTVILFVTVPLRMYQKKVLMDSKTGFFTSGDYTLALLMGILAVFVLLLIIMCSGCKNVPKQYVLKKNIFAGTLGFAVGIFLLLQSSSGLLSYVTGSNESVTFIMSVASAIAAIAFIFMAVCSFSEKNIFRSAPLIALFTTIWGCTRLILTFLHYTNIVSNSENMLDITSVVFILLFLFSHAKLLAGIENEKTAKHAFAFGMSAIVTVCVFNIPTLLMYVVDGESPAFTKILPNLTDLLMICYILCFLVEMTISSGRSNSLEKNSEEDGLPRYTKRLTETQKHIDADKPKAQFFDSVVYGDEPQTNSINSAPQKIAMPREELPKPKATFAPIPVAPPATNSQTSYKAAMPPQKEEVSMDLDEIDRIIAEISAKDSK